MIKIVSLSKTREKKENSFLANFNVSGTLVPLRVSETERPLIYAEIQNLINTSSSDVSTDLGVALFNLMSPEASIKKQINESVELSGNVKIINGHIYFGEYLLEDTLESHMLSLLDDENTPKDEEVWKSYVRFLDNLHQNVSEDIRNQLFRWMEYERSAGNEFGITSDGCIVGYKGCAGTILAPTSVHEGFAIVDGVEMNGVIPNKVGSVITMPRSAVEYDPNVGCSTGLHVGTRDYAIKWAPILTLVKVNPRDVVSVPYECKSQKMRVCEYTVLEVTDATGDHKRIFNLEDEELYIGGNQAESFTRVPQEDYALSIEDCHDLLYEEITVIYSDNEKEFTGTVVDVYESWNGNDDGVVLKDDYGNYKHIKLYRINDWELESTDEDRYENEETREAEENLSDKIARELSELLKEIQDEFGAYEGPVDEGLTHKIKSIRVGHYVEVSYDDNEKNFEGVVSSIYKDYEGLIIRSDFGDVKHIKVNRISDIAILDNSDDQEEELGSQESVTVNVGSKVFIQYIHNGKIAIEVGVVLKELNGFLRVVRDSGFRDIKISDIVSITEI